MSLKGACTTKLPINMFMLGLNFLNANGSCLLGNHPFKKTLACCRANAVQIS